MLHLPTHIQKEFCYLQNSGLEWSNVSSTIPMEESGENATKVCYTLTPHVNETHKK